MSHPRSKFQERSASCAHYAGSVWCRHSYSWEWRKCKKKGLNFGFPSSFVDEDNLPLRSMNAILQPPHKPWAFFLFWSQQKRKWPLERPNYICPSNQNYSVWLFHYQDYRTELTSLCSISLLFTAFFITFEEISSHYGNRASKFLLWGNECNYFLDRPFPPMAKGSDMDLQR